MRDTAALIRAFRKLLSLVLTCRRDTCDIAAGIARDTVPIGDQKSPATEAMSVFTAGMPAKLTRVRLRRRAGGKGPRCFLLAEAIYPTILE